MSNLKLEGFELVVESERFYVRASQDTAHSKVKERNDAHGGN
jgi:hypothetical protein